ncbi:MAG: substrate-binding domain-containing protein, partial [Lentisphaerae bacterium]|nr:substrate-binding domain-containing protein [Lentisphaerota bacterium]
IAAVTQHIPDKSFQLVRYIGWYSNKMRGQRRKHSAEEALAAGKAVEVYRAAREAGLRIPGDLSVVGFANLNFSPLIDPPLTTVDQCGAEIGHRAARLILDRIANPNRRRRAEIVATQLIVRASTAPPAAR